MADQNKFKKQAVVIIHGMGEQRPMDTLRSFVKGVKSYLERNDVSERTTIVRSKPDGVSEIYETRKLSLTASRTRPITDFYEFYWAQNMRETVFGHTTAWLFRLVFTPLSRIPPRLTGLWRTVWVLIALIMVITVTILLLLGVGKVKTIIAGLAAVPLLFSVIGVIQKYFANLFLTTAGDAARYFTPTPSNIAERNNIRQQGITFLKKLHEQVDGENYDRVIIVAHSLGTAVAYDLLRLLWTVYHDTYAANPVVDQSLLLEFDKLIKAGPVADVEAFQQLQYRLWKQQRATGNQWLVTDFITMGSAVCSADYFQLNSVPFTELVEEREFPVCPPVLDDKTKSISFDGMTYDVEIQGMPQKRTVRFIHHAGLFALTRWTNIYFTSDFVGSEGCRIFGKGVKDVSLPRKSLWFLPGGHTNYWDIDSEESLAAITAALKLRSDANP